MTDARAEHKVVPTELARYTIGSGERVIRGQRIDGEVILLDAPRPAQPRSLPDAPRRGRSPYSPSRARSTARTARSSATATSTAFHTNAIEALKPPATQRGQDQSHFPNENSARKLVYLACIKPSRNGPEPGTGQQRCSRSRSTSTRKPTVTPSPVGAPNDAQPEQGRLPAGPILARRSKDQESVPAGRPPLKHFRQSQRWQRKGGQT